MGDHSHHDHDHMHDHGGHNHDSGMTDSIVSSTEASSVSQSAHAHDGPTVHHTMMHMAFQAGLNEVILFTCWTTSGVWSMVGSCVIIFLLAFSYEALKFYREVLYRRSCRTIQYNTVTVPVQNGSVVKETQGAVEVKIFSGTHAAQTVLHVVQVIASYFLMLIFMTYNVWLCLAVVLGAGAGYFVFGWKKALIVDTTEQCH